MEPDISVISSLIGDRARSKILMALMSGKALTATELACEADVTAQTASNHLSKLVDSKLLIVRKQGRHKYFQLASHQVAEALEALLNLSSTLVPQKVTTGPTDPDLRKSRICYDHLAGLTGVLLYEALVANKWLAEQSQQVALTKEGVLFFQNQGAAIDSFKQRKRPVCKSCLDWSERKSHLAGSLGQWVLEDALAKQWAVRRADSRAITFSHKGLLLFSKRYQIDRSKLL
ncbi:transcriptional regulator [Microbulbifer sp. A4B17]|uniref:ArsR/SmtB family transcription factor n=1 Tax=Microbulbifer sp. A4B17 TaxID=359370 RepID=UPI000D52BB89|nr:helix-turn-helix domain-containing protein [Microbulbifer sp. A4B17]AWF83027.1 transcriptional regulator [Microbulbifer sp. A4B17]